jgi:hypothetical protein
MRFVRGCAVLFALGFPGGPSSAAGGVIEINQAVAISGGVNGDLVADPPGFPVRITRPGSYRLTGNLDVSIAQSTAIQIDSVDVTLDLGGFRLQGDSVCTGYPTQSCTATPPIYSGIISDQYLVSVRNGSVAGMRGDGIRLTGDSSEVDRVRVLGCAGSGIFLAGPGRVSRSFSGGNAQHGISLGQGGSAEDNEVRANGAYGIHFATYLSIPPRLPGAMTGNRIFDNRLGGVFSGGGGPTVVASRNVASDNAGITSGNDGSTQIGGVVASRGNNLCNGTLC